MGIEEEADRTLFIRNLDSKVSLEVFHDVTGCVLQAGPLVRTKIPKDTEGKQKTFGFVVYKHDVSAPYAMQLLDGTSLFGRNIHVQFRSGSSHGSSPGNSQNSTPANTPNPHGQRTPAQFSSPSYSHQPPMQRSFSSPDSLQKHAMMNNVMWQFHMQQVEQLNDAFTTPPQRQNSGGRSSVGGGSRHHDNAPYRHHPSKMGSGGRTPGYRDEPTYQQQQHSHGRESYHQQNNRSGNRYPDSRGGNRHYDDRGGDRGYQDNRWRRY
ncbi:RNA-binding protein 7 [Oryzias melastigma]|uniref:RNA-binding protein 7 n=1 Tax=Oryzias melastigma TaxID=30732 RepID=UPI000CF806CD|nr:RNA-binding protein 7 [Oryzias melastigma]